MAARGEAVPQAIADSSTEPTVALPPEERPRPAAPAYVPSSRTWASKRGPRMAGASEVWTHLRARLEYAPAEELWMLMLDARHRIVRELMVARGSLTGVEVHPREIFRPAIAEGAAAIILAHNHPSGDPMPSRADVELTNRLLQVAELVGIPLLDHIVIGAEGFTSLAERNWK